MHFSSNCGLRGYPTLFVVAATTLGSVGMIFALTGRRTKIDISRICEVEVLWPVRKGQLA